MALVAGGTCLILEESGRINKFHRLKPVPPPALAEKWHRL
jgi:hypothetical protein